MCTVSGEILLFRQEKGPDERVRFLQIRPVTSVGGNVQNVRCLTRPTQARQDAPIHGQGRSHFDARSVLSVRGTAKWRPACAKPLRQAGNPAGLLAVALAKAGGFFQHSPCKFSLTPLGKGIFYAVTCRLSFR